MKGTTFTKNKKLMFRLTSALLSLLLFMTVTLLVSCKDDGGAAQSGEKGDAENEPVEITMWTYPVGGWGSSGTLSSLISSFHRDNPGIRVTVKTVTYETGDGEVEEAIKNGTAPDIVFEGPERLVAGWGARGLMADLSDVWADGGSDGIYESVRVACHDENGRYYIYPLCMTTHCMAINRDMFEAADAWKYIDEETHTWSTDDFIAAVGALRDYGIENVAAVYCGGQGGDQGTRALVNNLYGGTFTNAEHTSYTVNSPENIRALELLYDTDGINFDPDIVGTQEIEKFCDGELAMAFCWNVSMEIRSVVNGEDLGFDIFPMAFPTSEGTSSLQGGIWGFGVFDNGDSEKIEAAKTFIRYMTGDGEQYTRSVLASTYWPCREMPEIYDNDELMNEYGIFQKYFGDYYQVTPNWASARTAWWNMLRRVGEGQDAAEAVKQFETDVKTGS